MCTAVRPGEAPEADASRISDGPRILAGPGALA